MIKHALYAALASGLTAIALLADAHAYDNIIRPYQSIRTSGMGGVKLTTGQYDENFYGNPARAAGNPIWRVQLIDPMIEFNTNTTSTFETLTGSGDFLENMADTAGNNNHMRIQMSFPGIYLPNVRGGKMSFAFAMLTSIQSDFGLHEYYSLDPQALVDIGPAFTVARKFLENDALTVGLTTHVAYRFSTKANFGLADLFQGASMKPSSLGGDGAHLDFDLGATYVLPYKLKEWTLQPGISINNILGGKYSNLGMSLLNSAGSSSTTAADATQSLPTQQYRSFGLGISAYKEELWKFRDTMVAFEIQDLNNNPDGSMFRHVHLGGETRFSVLILPAGINQGYFTAGLGLDLKVLTLEYTTYAEEMALTVGSMGDRRHAFRLALQI